MQFSLGEKCVSRGKKTHFFENAAFSPRKSEKNICPAVAQLKNRVEPNASFYRGEKKNMAKITKKKTTKKPAAKKKTVAKIAAKPAKPAAKKTATKRKPNAAFMKPMTPSDTLAVVVGAKPLPRTEVTKKLWAYIKKNGLQDRRNINADDALKAVFGGKKIVSMFEMTKLVSKHLSSAA